LILNLGCGYRPREGAINQDKFKHSQWVDVAHDLNSTPWPWQDNTFNHVYMMDVLEHLQDVVKSLEEVHRILKTGGLFDLEVPGAHHQISFRDPTHLHFFTPESMDYFIPGKDMEKWYGFYSKMRWQMKSITFSPEMENIYFVMEKIS